MTCRFLLAVAIVLLYPVSVRAQDDCLQTADWVLFEVDEGFGAAFTSAAKAHLAAELEPRGVVVCTRITSASGTRPPLARVSVSRGADGIAILRIEDDVTQTTVQRSLDFSRVPEQGRAITLGMAADELLGVGWSSVIARRQPATPVTVQIPDGTPAPANLVTLSMNASVFRGGPSFLGPQLRLARMVSRLVPEVALGLRWGTALQGPHGQAEFSDVHAGAGTSWLLTPLSWRFLLGPIVGVEANYVTVQGQAAPGSAAREGHGMGVTAQAGFMGTLTLTETLRFTALVGTGYVIRPVRASDAGQPIGGIQSFVVQAAFGLGAVF